MKKQPSPPAPGSDSSLGEQPEWIETALAEHWQTRAWLEKLEPMPMNLGLKSLMWMLRVYVLFMITVVGINVAQMWH